MPRYYKRARDAGVQGMMIAGITLQTAEKAVQLASDNPGLFAAVGVHPHDAASCSEAVIDTPSGACQEPESKGLGRNRP